MASRRARQLAHLSSLGNTAYLRAPTRARIDLEFSKHDETRVSTAYSAQYETSNTILTHTASSRDAYPTRLPGELLPPELHDRSALSTTNLVEEWARLCSHQSMFATPSEFLQRINGLGLDALGGLVRAQAPGLSAPAATAVAQRILSHLSQMPMRDAVSGTDPTLVAAAAAETTRQLAALVSGGGSRGGTDYHAVWEGGDVGAMEALSDVLARAESSKHVAVVDALTRLAVTHGMPSVGDGIMPHHLLSIRVRTRAVAAWVFDHTLIDQFDVLYWILHPFIIATKHAGGREHEQVGPVVLPLSTDERGGTTQVGDSSGTHVAVYMIPAVQPGTGQFFLNGSPYTHSRPTAREHSRDAFGRPFALVGANLNDYDIWAEGLHAQSTARVGRALNIAFARALAALHPATRPLLRYHHYLSPDTDVSMGTRPGFAGWRVNKTVKKR